MKEARLREILIPSGTKVLGTGHFFTVHTEWEKCKVAQPPCAIPKDAAADIYGILAPKKNLFPMYPELQRYVLCCNYNNHYSMVCVLFTPLEMVVDDVTLHHFYLLHCDSIPGYHDGGYVDGLLGPIIGRRYYERLALEANPVGRTLSGWTDVRFKYVSVPVPKQVLSSCGPASLLFFERLLTAEVEAVMCWLTTSGKQQSAELLDLSKVLGLGDVTEPDYERHRSSLEKRFFQWAREAKVTLE
jgi:hypothetical protein